MKPYLRILVALLSTASVGLAQAPQTATIAGKIHNPPAREIELRYTSSLSPEDSEHRVVLDDANCFVLTLPILQGTFVKGYYKDRQSPRWKWLEGVRSFVFGPRPQLVFFVEPGDSLDVVVNEGRFSTSLWFRGQGADNNRFIAEMLSDYLASHFVREDYEGLQVEDFSRQAEQRRQDGFERLAKGREQYALSPGLVEYATAVFNYEWANNMISYPMMYRYANGHENRDITPEYYNFLKEIPLVDEKAIGVSHYRWFLRSALDWESDQVEPDPPALSEQYDLASLGLSAVAQAELDSLYERDGRQPSLSKMVDLAALGLADAGQVQLDSLYVHRRSRSLSEIFDLAKFELSDAAVAQLDSFYERSGRQFSWTHSKGEDAFSIDTLGTRVVFHLPEEEELPTRPSRLSELLDWSGLSLADAALAHLDSLYEHRQPLKLSEKIDLAGLGLPVAAHAQLDSIYATHGQGGIWFKNRYDLIEEKLSGRVLYWVLAGELIDGFKHPFHPFAAVRAKRKEFAASNPYPEYNEAVQAALDRALALQPGQPAPDFTLRDLDGQSVSLSQFKGQVVFIDFWASWCGPCISNLPDLHKVQEKVAAQPVVFINLSLDEDEADWLEAIAEHEVAGIHLRADGWSADVAKAYSINAIPSYYLVDSQGLIVERLMSVGDTDGIVAMIEQSL